VKTEQKAFLKFLNLVKLGLGNSNKLCTGISRVGLSTNESIIGLYGACKEISTGKDTPSGHWEITGVPVRFDWGYFLDKENSFPQKLIDALIEQTDIDGILGNCHGSGTEILKRLGQQHIPFIAYRPNQVKEINVGIRNSFCDIGQSIANHL